MSHHRNYFNKTTYYFPLHINSHTHTIQYITGITQVPKVAKNQNENIRNCTGSVWTLTTYLHTYIYSSTSAVKTGCAKCALHTDPGPYITLRCLNRSKVQKCITISGVKISNCTQASSFSVTVPSSNHIGYDDATKPLLYSIKNTVQSR